MSGGVAGDVCGHIIANVLGGSGTVEYNIFPQSGKLNNGNWKSMEGKVKTFLKESPNNAANIRIWFNYETPTRTRPASFFGYTEFVKGRCY